MIKRFKATKTLVSAIKCQGGVNVTTPGMNIAPGNLLTGMNYVAGDAGGYKRIDGYERYTGEPEPSMATYEYCEVTKWNTINLLDIITGGTSGASGVVIINDAANSLCITNVSGTFIAGESLACGLIVGLMDRIPVQCGEDTAYRNAVALLEAANWHRQAMTVLSGSGPVRGIFLLKGVLYCIRDNASATAGVIYKESPTGWSAVPFYHTLSFSTGIAEIYDNDTITQLVSGATADVKRVVLESGTWAAGTATGRLILGSITGTFNAVNDLQVAAATKATSTSIASQISILPGGNYETVEYNFTGSTDTRRIYGCDGVNPGFEFDGDVYLPIFTKMTIDIPSHVVAHKKHLFFSFFGSSQNSGLGTPYKWTPVSGAAEIALGDNVTAYGILPGQALAIFTQKNTYQLLGSSSANFVLDIISNDIGCIAGTAQTIGKLFAFDAHGVCLIAPADSYGNFLQAIISRHVQKHIDNIYNIITATVAYKKNSQYRVFGSDGSGLVMTISTDQKGSYYSFTQIKYPFGVTSAVAGKNTDGKEVIFLGSDDGVVYKADIGNSFDGNEIEAYIRFPFNHNNSPTVLKSYRKAVFELNVDGYVELKIHPDFSYGDPNVSQHTVSDVIFLGSGGSWDVDNWESFYYDSTLTAFPSFQITGDGTNISMFVYSKSAINSGHTIEGILLHYTPRRHVR